MSRSPASIGSPNRYKTIEEIRNAPSKEDIVFSFSPGDDGSIEITSPYHYHEGIGKLISIDTTDNNNINVSINFDKDYSNLNDGGNDQTGSSIVLPSVNEYVLPTPKIANTSECPSSMLGSETGYAEENDENKNSSNKKTKEKKKKLAFFRKKKPKPSISSTKEVLSKLNNEEISQEQLKEIKKTLAALSAQVKKLESKENKTDASAMRTDNSIKRRFLLSFLRRKKRVVTSEILKDSPARLPLTAIREDAESNAFKVSAATPINNKVNAKAQQTPQSTVLGTSTILTSFVDEGVSHVSHKILNDDSASLISLLTSDRYRITEKPSATPNKYYDASILELHDLSDPTRCNNKSKPEVTNKVDSVDESVVQSWVYEVVCAASDELGSKNNFSTLKAKHTAQRMIFNALQENINNTNDKAASTRYQEIAASTASLIITGLSSKISKEQVTVLAVSVLTSRDCYKKPSFPNKNYNKNQSIESIFTDTERSESYVNCDTYTDEYDSSKINYKNDSIYDSTFDEFDHASSTSTCTSWTNIFRVCFGSAAEPSSDLSDVNFDSFTDTMLTTSITDLDNLSSAYQQSMPPMQLPSVGTAELEDEYFAKVRKARAAKRAKSKKANHSNARRCHEKKGKKTEYHDDYLDDECEERDEKPRDREDVKPKEKKQRSKKSKKKKEEERSSKEEKRTVKKEEEQPSQTTTVKPKKSKKFSLKKIFSSKE